MPTIVYQKNKNTGTVYAYESISYWDREKKQPRCKRRYLGKVDPKTKEIISPKAKTDNVETASSSEELAALYAELKRKDKMISELSTEKDAAYARYEELAEKVRKIRAYLDREFIDV